MEVLPVGKGTRPSADKIEVEMAIAVHLCHGPAPLRKVVLADCWAFMPLATTQQRAGSYSKTGMGCPLGWYSSGSYCIKSH